ncbi:MAG: sigma 54-interacting transcriptional regulator [Planctomycetes bacterium]|nr:sigma 54-interacting transcriptional regulator [Planctomycetota bacterium]
MCPDIKSTLRPEDLISLIEISKAMVAEPDMDKLLTFILNKATEVLKAERSSLFMYNPQTNQMESRIAQKADFKITVPMGKGIVGHTAQERKSVICPDTYNDPHFMQLIDKMTGYKTRNILSTPLITPEGDLIGVIEVLNKIEAPNKSETFSDYDVSLVEAFASYATIAIRNAAQRAEIHLLNKQLSDKLETIEKELQVKYQYGNIIGQSPKMQEIYRLLEKAKDTSFAVLIQGESGTGKELIARAIHFNGPRAGEKFLSQNCTAIPESLLEAELFGYAKGAFTGANQDRKGLFALADKGTLFLDEIADMSQEMQKKLLRVIQEGELRPIGGKEILKVDVRLVTASNKDIRELVQQKKFREDLFYRLNVIPITLPPLKERKDDIPLLVNHFLDKIAKETNSERKALDKEALKIFISYNWPGNVRELENEIKRMTVLCDETLRAQDISPHILNTTTKISIAGAAGESLTQSKILKEGRKEIEKHIITRALEENGWNITKAAEYLKMLRPNLSAKMKQLGIERPEK